MPILPQSYVAGFVTFQVTRCIGDVDANSYLERIDPSGEVVFVPVEQMYRSKSSPAVVVGNSQITAQVVGGVLVNTTGSEGIYLQTGSWVANFRIEGVSIPATRFELTDRHTPSAPLDLAAAVQYEPLQPALPIGSAAIVVFDTEDGGYLVQPQPYVRLDGLEGYVGVTYAGDGSIVLDQS